MMPLQAPVVSQYLRRRKQKDGSPQFAKLWIAIEKVRRQANPVAPEPPPQLPMQMKRRTRAEISRSNREVPPIRHQPADLGLHLCSEIGRAHGKADHHCFRILTEPTKQQPLEAFPP